MEQRSTQSIDRVVGLDLGDRRSHLCVMSFAGGEILERCQVSTTRPGLRRRFADQPRMRIALEVGGQSPWVSRLLSSFGHEVYVANARKLRLIYENRTKDDRVDAEYLARVARLDPSLLAPIRHRGVRAQQDLAVLRSRDLLVRSRASLIQHCRGIAKAQGHRFPATDARCFAARAGETLPAELAPALEPVLEVLVTLNERIRALDREVQCWARDRYPECQRLTQVQGVGALTAVCYVLSLEQPERFSRSRQVGPYLGLVPARADSGEHRSQLGIHKQGNPQLRRLLVQCAHYILGPFAEDSDLRRFGERLAERGGPRAKKRAVVAVARKLAVLLHHLWRTGEPYDPHYQRERQDAAPVKG